MEVMPARRSIALTSVATLVRCFASPARNNGPKKSRVFEVRDQRVLFSDGGESFRRKEKKNKNKNLLGAKGWFAYVTR